MGMRYRPVLIACLAALASPAVAEGPAPGTHFIENWDVDGDGAVDLADIEARRSDVFMAFDSNEDGALDAEEYVYFDEARANDMQAISDEGPAKGMQRAMTGMTLAFNDTDGNGEVSRGEFIDHVGDWLDLLDRDGDGIVTTADFGRK
jgi:hypothetical protein